MNYRLKIKETGVKAAKYQYIVLDENGIMTCGKRSNDSFIACTINGSHYFKSLDEIGKGDHGRVVKKQVAKGKTPSPIVYLEEFSENDDIPVSYFRKRML
jgi:hypothetical protein